MSVIDELVRAKNEMVAKWASKSNKFKTPELTKVYEKNLDEINKMIDDLNKLKTE